MTLCILMLTIFASTSKVWAQTEPRVGLELCEAGPDYIHVKGWAVDPDNKDYSIDVAVSIYTDQNCTQSSGSSVYNANKETTDVSVLQSIPGKHGFEFDFPIDAGNYWLKFVVNNKNNTNNTILGPYPVTVTAPLTGTVTLTSQSGIITLGNGATLTGTGGENTHVTIAAGATVTFSDVNITNYNRHEEGELPSFITCQGDATILLAKGTTNTIIGGQYLTPCIQVGPQNTTLTIKGYGTLVLRSWGWGSCIGGRPKQACGNIVIKGGTLDLDTEIEYQEQHLSAYAACIGGTGYGSSCGDITINGGNIHAVSHFGAAAIGSGREGTCGNINITGGTIYAYASSLQGGAGIGGGLNGGCGNISISGVTSVSAKKHSEKAPYCIGPGGGSGTCGTLTLWGQTSDYIVGTEYGTEVIAPTDVPYTVRFNANGGTGSMADQGFYSNTPQALTANGFSLSGKAIKCWSTEADGSGYDFYNGETVTNLGNVTLYAQWADIDYVVSFDANGGTGTMAGQNFAMNTTQALNANTFVCPGYAFAEWSTMQDGSGTNYTDKQSVSNLGNVTLYAQWTPTTYTITYVDAVNGTDNVTNTNPTNYAYMDNAITLTEPTRVGYTFDGWTYEGQDSPTKSVTIPQGTYGDWTFTAHWTESSNVVITEYTGNHQLQDGQTLSGTGGANTHITIADGATVTFSGVTITDHVNQWWPGITCDGDATIILDEGTTSTVAGGSGWSGIFVPEGHTLTIQGSGTLIANGSNAVGYAAAAIGGGGVSSASCGNIVITGGIITATGGDGSAGIGGGRVSDCGYISITGGTVNANGGYGAPGIGSGMYSWSDCDDITITAGVTSVTATKGTASNHSIGIGEEGTVGTITIGGTVTGGIPQSPFTYNPTNTEPYIVTFNANGGSGDMGNQTFAAYTIETLAANTFTRVDYDFIGWNTAADGSGTSFANGQTVFHLGTMTLYAQWQHPAGTLLEDEEETEGTAARWFVNMPATGTNLLTLDGSLSSFKVYDDGGKGGNSYDNSPCNYSNNSNSALILTAPEGYHINLSGSILVVKTSEGTDYLTVYDNNEASGITLINQMYSNCWADIPTVNSTGRSMTIYFYSDPWVNWGGLDLTVTLIPPTLTLADNTDNTTTIAEADGKPRNVALDGRTLYNDGGWNTLCLPFALSETQVAASPLAGAILKELDGSTSNLTNGTLTLNFTDATSIEAGRPYIVKWAPPKPDLTIKSDADWTAFAENVNNGTSYDGMIVALAADINVSAMVGGVFKGTFDGDGHTISVSISVSNSGDGESQALFREINGATIRNVNVTGTIQGNQRPATFASFVGGISTIRNCCSSVAISSTKTNGWVDGGAFVARINGDATLNLQDCLFTGSVSYDATAYSGGSMVGFTQSGAKGNVTNCFYSPTSLALTVSDSNPHIFVSGDERGIITNSYYNAVAKASILQEEGTDASSMTASELAAALGSSWQVSGESVVPKKYEGIMNPVFSGVTIDATAPTSVTSTDAAVSFVGTYAPVSFSDTDKSLLFLGAASTLYYPENGASIGACRAYFQLGNGLTVGDGSNAIQGFRLNFGDATGFDEQIINSKSSTGKWYDLSGRRIDGAPAAPGLYIKDGRKIIVK